MKNNKQANKNEENMIPYGRHHLDEEDIAAVVDVLRNGDLTQGPIVEAFEKAISEYLNVKYAVAVSSGTAALHISAIAAGLEKEKYLLTSPVTFVSSANCALFSGGKPTFADIDLSTGNISAETVQEALNVNPDIKVIIPVHLSGLACDMPAIKKIAEANNSVLIEDASHALGAKYPDGKYVGSCPDSLMTVFSFHPVKSIASGEGGMVTTNDEKTYRKLIRLRSHGINKLNDSFINIEQSQEGNTSSPWYYEMQEIGFNYRITDIQCGLALSQLKKLNKFIARRRELVKVYDQAFSDIDLIRPLQTVGKDISSHHLYIVRIDFEKAGITRSELMHRMHSAGVYTQVHYIPLPMQPFYRALGFVPEDYPNAMKYYDEALSLPLFYDLSDEQQQYVINQLKEILT